MNKLNERELENQLNNIISFINLVHPSLGSDGLAVEIRPIQRVGDYNYMLNRSLNLWKLDKKGIKYLKAFLERVNGEAVCLYYSVFSFDSNLETLTSAGKPAVKGKITLDSAMYSESIVLDFDDIEYEGYQEKYDMLAKYNIYANWVFSGHGYQAIIPLNEKLYDKYLIKRFVSKLNDLGLGIDDACTDAARVMRLPWTNNYKLPEEHANPPKTGIINHSSKRYSIESLLSELDLNTEEEVFTDVSDVIDRADVDSYKLLSSFDLPDAIHQMLSETPRGYRNSVLGFLIKYFRDNYSLGKNQLFGILSEWSDVACIPKYENFKYDFNRLYYSGGLVYTSELAKMFGSIDFEKYATLEQRKFIKINEAIIDSFIDIKGNTLNIFSFTKISEHLEKPVTRESLVKFTGFSDRTVRTAIKDALDNELLYKVNGIRKQGIPDTYHSTKLFNTTSNNLVISVNDLRGYTQDLNMNQLKIYLYLSYLFQQNRVYISQSQIAEFVGLSRNRVSEIITELEELFYIQVKRNLRGEAVVSCVYTLLR